MTGFSRFRLGSGPDLMASCAEQDPSGISAFSLISVAKAGMLFP